MNTYNGKLYILAFILLAILSSCTERIDIDLDNTYTRLVVEGAMTTDTMPQTVRLTTTTSYYYNEAPPAVEGATVTISDGYQTYYLTEKLPGIYQTDSAVFGVPGKTYSLHISLKSEVGGRSEYSASSVLNPVAAMDSISLIFHDDWTDKGMWEVKGYVAEPPTKDFYRIMLYRNDILITDTIDEWMATDDRFFNGNYTNGLTMAYLLQSMESQRLLDGDKVTLEVNNIDERYAYFIWDAQTEFWGSNPMFSGPPANIKGNISDGAFGYFAAYSVNRVSATAHLKE